MLCLYYNDRLVVVMFKNDEEPASPTLHFRTLEISLLHSFLDEASIQSLDGSNLLPTALAIVIGLLH